MPGAMAMVIRSPHWRPCCWRDASSSRPPSSCSIAWPASTRDVFSTTPSRRRAARGGLGLWFQLLDYVQLGVAQPLMGTSYALIALASRVVFKEKVDARRWAGIALIIAGLAVIGAFER